MSDIQCGKCEKASPVGSLYCVHCGTRLGGGECLCGGEIPGGSAYCPHCGGRAAARGRSAEIDEDGTPLGAPVEMKGGEARLLGLARRGIRWARANHEVAARITPAELRGLLAKSGLEIQPGTRALLFVGGRYVATLPPGRHTLETLAQSTGFSSEGEPAAIVVDDGELGLTFEVKDLHSADHHNVELVAQASMRLAEPESFIANLMRDRDRYSLSELQGFLAREAQRSLREMVARYNAESLFSGRASAELEMELLSRWKATLDRTGFTLNRFRVLDFHLPGLESAEDMRSETRDKLLELRAGFEGRQAFFDVDLSNLEFDWSEKKRRLETDRAGEREVDEVDINHEIEQLKQKANGLNRRNPVLERFLQEGVLQKAIEIGARKDDEAWEKLRLQLDKDKLLRDEEWHEIEQTAKSERGNLENRLQALSDRLGLIAKAELDELKANQAVQLSLLGLRGDTEFVQEKARTYLAQLDGEIERRKRTLDQELLESDRKFAQEISFEKSKADLQHERMQRMVDLDLLRKERASALKIQEEVSRAEIEYRRFEKEQESFSMMTADQILAAAVARSPEKANEIAATIRAMKSGEASEIQKQMYERMVDEIKSISGRAQDLDHEKFRLSVDADARHRAKYENLDEREKKRAQEIATAGLTADDKKKVLWDFCEIHKMKYLTSAGCPLCARGGA